MFIFPGHPLNLSVIGTDSQIFKEPVALKAKYSSCNQSLFSKKERKYIKKPNIYMNQNIEKKLSKDFIKGL